MLLLNACSPDVLFKTCVAIKFVDDNDDDDRFCLLILASYLCSIFLCTMQFNTHVFFSFHLSTDIKTAVQRTKSS